MSKEYEEILAENLQTEAGEVTSRCLRPTAIETEPSKVKTSSNAYDKGIHGRFLRRVHKILGLCGIIKP